MLIGQLVIALLLFWVLPISKAAEIQETDIKLSLGTWTFLITKDITRQKMHIYKQGVLTEREGSVQLTS